MYLDEEALHRFVGYKAQKSSEGYGHETERKRDAPFAATDVSNLESDAADENDKNLHAELCGSVSQDARGCVRCSAYQSE